MLEEEDVIERTKRIRRWAGEHLAVLRSATSAFMHGLAWRMGT